MKITEHRLRGKLVSVFYGGAFIEHRVPQFVYFIVKYACVEGALY